MASVPTSEFPPPTTTPASAQAAGSQESTAPPTPVHAKDGEATETVNAPSKPEQQSDKALDTPAASTGTPAAWQAHYDGIHSKLPPVISSRIPNSGGVSELGRSGSVRLKHMKDQIVESSGGLKTKVGASGVGRSLTVAPDKFLSHAYSITNATEVALNVSLNQVGPLMYATLPPNATLERRVPKLFFFVEVRPHTTLSTPYTPWSTAWPILALTGPAVALTSLIAIPFVALAAGGSALASLTGWGVSVAEGVGSVATGAASVGTSSATGAAGMAAKVVSTVPGAARVKGKLMEAAKANLGKGQEMVNRNVVKYLERSTAAAAGTAVAEGEKKAKKREKKKLGEVDVTGYPLDKVLECQTGHKMTDKKLEAEFKSLRFKTRDFQAANNPVLQITGGPTLSTVGTKQFLVFHSLVLEPVPNTVLEPLSPTEAPLLDSEATLIRDAKVVDTMEEAEKLVKEGKVGVHGEEGKTVKGEVLQH